MSTSNAVSNVLGNFGGQLGLVNTGMGMKNADGTINVSGTLQGIAATTESQLALAGKSYGPVQFGIGVWGIYNVYDQVKENYQTTNNVEVTGAQWSSLAGNGLNVVMGIAKSTPWGAAGSAVATVAELGFNIATASQQPSNPNYSNEGRNYQTPTYSVGAQVETPAPVSYALTPGSLRGTGAATNAMPANSGVFASQMARNAAFEVAWAQALTEHSTPPAPTSFPTDPAAYVGLEDAFGSPVPISCIGITGNPQLMGDANSATNDANYRRYA